LTKNLIFIFYSDLGPDDRFKYGLDPLAEQGFKTTAWVFYPLVTGERPRPSDHLVFSAWPQLEAAIAALEPGTVLLDFFAGLSVMTFRMERIYRMFKKANLKLVIPSVAPLPLGIGYSLAQRLKGITSRKLKDFVGSRVLFLAKKHTHLYPKPVKVFSLDNDSLEYYCRRNHYDPELVVPIHSMEYDRFLRFVRAGGRLQVKEKAVFLDEAFVSHPDKLRVLGLSEVPGAEVYFEKMTQLFNRIEQQTGLNVIIAAHPRVQYQNEWGDREVVYHQSLEQVAQAKIVVAHSSTSVSLAVLFDRPLLLVDLKGANRLVGIMSRLLKASRIDLENPRELEYFNFKDFANRSNSYQFYRDHYLKSPKADPKKTCWEIIGPALKEL